MSCITGDKLSAFSEVHGVQNVLDMQLYQYGSHPEGRFLRKAQTHIYSWFKEHQNVIGNS